MPVLCDRSILHYVHTQSLIAPCSERVAGEKIVSFGLQPAGYDARLDPAIEVCDDAKLQGRVNDPLAPINEAFVRREASPFLVLPRHTFARGRTIERFRIPRFMTARGVGKTTYSAQGIVVLISSINPGWEGHLILHIANYGPAPVRLYGSQGIVQLQFEMLDGPCESSYAELWGTKFQGAAEKS